MKARIQNRLFPLVLWVLLTAGCNDTKPQSATLEPPFSPTIEGPEVTRKAPPLKPTHVPARDIETTEDTISFIFHSADADTPADKIVLRIFDETEKLSSNQIKNISWQDAEPLANGESLEFERPESTLADQIRYVYIRAFDDEDLAKANASEVAEFALTLPKKKEGSPDITKKVAPMKPTHVPTVDTKMTADSVSFAFHSVDSDTPADKIVLRVLDQTKKLSLDEVKNIRWAAVAPIPNHGSINLARPESTLTDQIRYTYVRAFDDADFSKAKASEVAEFTLILPKKVGQVVPIPPVNPGNGPVVVVNGKDLAGENISCSGGDAETIVVVTKSSDKSSLNYKKYAEKDWSVVSLGNVDMKSCTVMPFKDKFVLISQTTLKVEDINKNKIYVVSPKKTPTLVSRKLVEDETRLSMIFGEYDLSASYIMGSDLFLTMTNRDEAKVFQFSGIEAPALKMKTFDFSHDIGVKSVWALEVSGPGFVSINGQNEFVFTEKILPFIAGSTFDLRGTYDYYYEPGTQTIFAVDTTKNIVHKIMKQRETLKSEIILNLTTDKISGLARLPKTLTFAAMGKSLLIAMSEALYVLDLMGKKIEKHSVKNTPS